MSGGCKRDARLWKQIFTCILRPGELIYAYNMCIYTRVELQRKLCRVVEDQVEKIMVSEVVSGFTLGFLRIGM